MTTQLRKDRLAAHGIIVEDIEKIDNYEGIAPNPRDTVNTVVERHECRCTHWYDQSASRCPACGGTITENTPRHGRPAQPATETQGQHTPLPWLPLDEESQIRIVRDIPARTTIAVIDKRSGALEFDDNAALIIRAVNGHAQMVSDLRAAISYLEDDSRSQRRRQECLRSFRETLRLAATD